MNFSDRLNKINELETIISDYKRLFNVKFDEDIENRAIRDYMYCLGLLRNSVAGCYGSDVQDYYAEQAINLINEFEE